MLACALTDGLTTLWCAVAGDFGLVKAWKADTRGNLVFRGTAMNFNMDMAKASKICIAEVSCALCPVPCALCPPPSNKHCVEYFRAPQ